MDLLISSLSETKMHLIIGAMNTTIDLLLHPSVLLSFGLLLLSLLVKIVCTPKPSSINLPPGPWKIPIIGSIHHLLTELPHIAFHRLAKKHGALMLVRLGWIDILVVSSRDAATVILKSQDLNFCSRPEMHTTRFLTYGATDIVFSPYGEYWRQLRKICTVELLSTKRVRSFYSLFHEEITLFISDIYKASYEKLPLNLSERLGALMNSIITRCALGSKSEDQQKFLLSVKEGLELSSGFSVSDLFPGITYMDVMSGAKSKLEKIHWEIDEILEGFLKEHELKRSMTSGVNEVEVEDLVDVLQRIKDHGQLVIPLTDDNIKAVILDMFIGGTETSSTVLAWAMSELIKNPKTMEKAKAEVRQVMKGKTDISESDLAELHYLKLVIKETLRLHPPGPLLLPRQCINTCQVDKYTIPAGTRVVVNAWALGRDPRYWGDNAECFSPERFGGRSVDFKGSNLEYIPFGAGRRTCPGIAFGEANMGLALARLLLHFDWELPYGMKAEELDMTESFGVAAARKTDLCLIATPYSL